MVEETEEIKSKFKLKKLIKTLQAIKGRHTELVTVYVPSGYSLHEVAGQLRSEQSTAENIKSKPVRKNVVASLEKIIRHLQLYKQTPEHGLALFCGNVSEKEGAAEIDLWAIEPPEPVKVKLYWCDQVFVLDPLGEMIAEKDIYGIICMDKSEADIAILKGKKIEGIAHFESIVPGKTRAGGQSSARFSRVREGLLNDWLKHVAEASNKIFEEHKDVKGILLSGSGPVKDMLLKEDFFHDIVRKKILGTVDTSYTGEHGLHETLERGEELLKEADVIKEKKILQRFFNELQRTNGLVAYGLNEVLKALQMGAVDTVIISEAFDKKAYEYLIGDEKKVSFSKQSEGALIGEKDLIEYFEEEVKNYGSKIEVVSSDTREGQQFAEFGIGAFLRYNI